MVEHDSESPERLAHREIYDTGLRILEHAGENCIRPVVVLPDQLERHGYSDSNIVIIREGEALREDDDFEYSSENCVNTPQLNIEVVTLSKPLWLHSKGYIQIVNRLINSSGVIVKDGLAELVSDWRIIKVPSPKLSDISAEQKETMPTIMKGDKEDSSNQDFWKSVNDGLASLRTQRELGLDVVNLDERFKISNVLSDQLHSTRAGIPDLAEREQFYGPRVSQPEMRALWKAAHAAVRGNSKLVTPKGFTRNSASFMDELRIPRSMNDRPHRRATLDLEALPPQARHNAESLGMAGAVSITERYVYFGYDSAGKYCNAQPPQLEISFPVTGKDEPDVIRMRASPYKGLIISRVNGTLPAHHFDEPAQGGHHLNQEYCSALTDLFEGVAKSHESKLRTRLLGRASQFFSRWQT